MDRLNIVAHDKFQEIVDEAKRPDSAIRLKAVILTAEEFGEKDGNGGVPLQIDYHTGHGEAQAETRNKD